MTIIDWIVVCAPLVVVIVVGVRAQQCVKSVADFMAANRLAGRYLLCLASNELQTGAVIFVSAFEVFSHGGFAYNWWGLLTAPVVLLITISGFVVYRFRETRALTLGQFFEIRYDKSFRLFTGLLGFFAGLLNFGIIPAIGARVMVYFLGLPETVRILGLTMDTYVPLMALFLCLTLGIALSGGAITVMLINTVEGIMSQFFSLIIIATILMMFTWPEIHAVLMSRPPGHSLVNPFDTAAVKDFNLWNVFMLMITAILATSISWQSTGAYKTAALTPHEGRMSGLLTNWLSMGNLAVMTLLALAVVTYLHHPAFAAGAAHVEAVVHQISNKQAQEQMEAPIALAYFLPVGVKGIFCALLLMGILGGDATHLHSWGSIAVQDFLVPLRRKPFDPRVHLLILRASIIGVAIFAFLFGTFFHLADYILMWWGVTQAIFTGGAGAAIIGGLYWKKGTAAGAWAGFLTGSTLSVGGIIVQQVCTFHGVRFFLNGTQIGFFSSILAVAMYAVVSLLTYRKDFDLDRMLHRGRFAAVIVRVGDVPVEHWKPKPGWSRFLGFDDNFTLSDKWIAGGVLGWTLIWAAVFVVGSIWNLVAPWSTETWVRYSYFTGISVPIFLAVVGAFWFTWGGLMDILAIFRRLRHQHINHLDDGTVVNHQNLDEVVKNFPSS